MIAVATGEISSLWITFAGKNREKLKPFIAKYQKAMERGEGVPLHLTIGGGAVIAQEGSGKINFIFTENPTVEVEDAISHRTRSQNSTLRGLERFIAWAMLHRRPTDRECEFIHEALIDEAAPQILNPVNGRMMPKRTSMMNVAEMAILIEHALVTLGGMDISDEVMQAIGGDMVILWQTWYAERYRDDDPLFEHEQGMSWEQYSLARPICELCGVGGNPGDPLERMHIVSGGADPKNYEEPWNWLRAHHGCHMRQHRFGWSTTLNEHPHITGKINRAREIAGKRGIL
jgi:hypothetical protein